ncbi:coiled-coil domain-containing protein 50 isoform 1-T1 [Mantella aurantiaca]
MTEISIDSSKLPGVKEVCRDFAVLEDHSLAHTLQEQEIEHHLATNIQRNRLVKHDLKVAKQLQEEEDLIAQAQTKHRHNDLELLDSEIAQEIQEKLVIEAESRRRQEEKDEDIARLLQEREEKRRKKHYPPHGTEEPYYPDHGGHHRGKHKEHMSEFDRHHRHERPERSKKEGGHPKSKQLSHYDDDRKRGRSAEPRSVQGENNPESPRPDNHIGRISEKKEKPERPPPPRTSRHQQSDDEEPNGAHSSEYKRRGRSHSYDLLGTKNADVRRPLHSPNSRSARGSIESEYDHERQRRETQNEYEYERKRRGTEREYEHERKSVAESEYEPERHRRRTPSPNNERRRRRTPSPNNERRRRRTPSPNNERPRRRADSEHERKGSEGEYEHKGHRRRAENKYEHEKHRRRTPSPKNERQERDGGNRPKGHRDCPQGKLRIGGRNQDEDDAVIARKLQEEELRVNTVDYKAAQLAQDEEIARWLTEKEGKSHKKSKGREKTSEKRRGDEQELSSHELVRPRSKDEHHRSRNDKPYRPLPPAPDEDCNQDYNNDYTNRDSHSSPRPSSKSQSSHRGSHHRQ